MTLDLDVKHTRPIASSLAPEAPPSALHQHLTQHTAPPHLTSSPHPYSLPHPSPTLSPYRHALSTTAPPPPNPQSPQHYPPPSAAPPPRPHPPPLRDARLAADVGARIPPPLSIEDSASTRQSPSTPSQPFSAGSRPPRMPTSTSEPWGQPPPVPHQSQPPLHHHHPQQHPDAMHDVQYPPTYQQQQQQQPDPYAPRRYSMQQHHEPQTPGPPYMQHPEPAYTPYGQEPDATHQRRKAVRAAQACENCRQKKSKCDEQRPECSSCLQSNLKCQYREVPPPKQEKSMQQVTDLLLNVLQKVESIGAKVETIDARCSRLEDAQHRHPIVAGSPNTASARHSPANGMRSPLAGPAWSHAASSANGLVFKQEGEEMKRSGSSSTALAAVQMATSRSSDAHISPGKATLEEPKRVDTQAHNLLSRWDSIRPFVHGVLQNSDEDYVLAAEESRGILKIYGAAPGPERHRGPETASTSDSPAAYSDFSEQSNGVSGESWGHAGSRICNFVPVDRTSDVLPGGLHARTGHIQLDRQTFDRLYDSYLRHLHVLHPFINKDRVQQTVDKIFSPPQSLFAVSDLPSSSRDIGVGQKRKRPDHDTGNNDRVSPHMAPTQMPPPPGALERSPDVAVLLLICALGRVCEEKSNLEVSVSNVSDHFNTSDGGGIPSPHASLLSSPIVTTPRSATFPGGSTSSRDRRNRAPLNIETHPGLAYYAEAREILGDMTGSHSMSYVHANLLAGIYMAQFVRILESYRAIHEACVSCIILIHQLGFKRNPELLDNYARLTFWSCLQMESDILAELSFPKSGITQYEEDVPVPATGDEKVMVCYSAQITLRKILNQSTWYLYDGNTPMLNNPTRSLESLSQMSSWLEGWRTATASTAKLHGIADLAWEDDDEPATDINIARIRGKYYGAKYIIHRPFLKHILNQERNNASAQTAQTYGNPQAGMAMKSEEYNTMVKHAQTCVNAAIKSTYAFDGYREEYGRLLVTNIFGTAHAQFGNSLVLAATSLSPGFSWMVNKETLDALLNRTIQFFQPLARLSPTMTNDLRILYNTKRVLLFEDEKRATAHHRSQPVSASQSFHSSGRASASQSFPP